MNRLFLSFFVAVSIGFSTFRPAIAYKILVIPLPAKSHLFTLVALADGLASRGHEVTVLFGQHLEFDMPELHTNPGLKIERYDDMTGGNATMDYEAILESVVRTSLDSRSSMSAIIPLIRNASRNICHPIFTVSDVLMEKLQNQNFDIAILNGVPFIKCLYLIPHRLQIPWISATVAFNPLQFRVPWLPSFVPNPMFPFADDMTFAERVQNTFGTIAVSLLTAFLDPPVEILDKFRQYGPFRDLDDLMSKSVFWFLVSDPVLDYPKPMMPNMVNIGGLSVKRSVGELPHDISEFINGSKHGVILVTFGSMISSFSTEIVQKFANTFRRLDGYRVIWRLNNKDKVKLPDNVMIASWLPQNDILAHHHVKLFITHCGNNGQFEAIYHGVPMIGFPMLNDQYHNARRLEYKGYGISMDLYSFTSDQLFENIQKILFEKTYKTRAAKGSEMFRSQPQSPMERAAFWIEHICKFGSDHLRSAGNDLPLYAYLMLDIAAVALMTFTLAIFGLLKLVRYTRLKCCGQEEKAGKLKLH